MVPRVNHRNPCSVGAQIDKQLQTSPRLHLQSIPAARVPSEYRTHTHEIWKFIAGSSFVAKASPGFGRADLNVNELFDDIPHKLVTRTCGDYTCRYGLKCMSTYAAMMPQKKFVESDWVYMDGSRICKSTRDAVVLDSGGMMSVCFHQKMQDAQSLVLEDEPCNAAEHQFKNVSGTADRKRRTSPTCNNNSANSPTRRTRDPRLCS